MMYIPISSVYYTMGSLRFVLNTPSFFDAPFILTVQPQKLEILLPLKNKTAGTYQLPIACFPLHVHYVDTTSTPVS